MHCRSLISPSLEYSLVRMQNPGLEKLATKFQGHVASSWTPVPSVSALDAHPISTEQGIHCWVCARQMFLPAGTPYTFRLWSPVGRQSMDLTSGRQLLNGCAGAPFTRHDPHVRKPHPAEACTRRGVDQSVPREMWRIHVPTCT